MFKKSISKSNFIVINKIEVYFSMEPQLKKKILFDVLDGIPSSGNESEEVVSYRETIEQSYLTLEEEAMNLGISRDVIEFTEDFR